MPILQDVAERFANNVYEASDKRFKIKIFAGGELIPPLGVFDAVRQGTVECGYGSPYYWAGKVPAAQFFGSMPFGMNAQQFNSWLIGGGGQELWDEVYAPFGIVPLSFGNTGMQCGGWFKKPIASMQDLNGLKMRIPGFGGKVLAKAGANVVLMPGGEIYTALERGVIDATEWISPFFDERLGLYRAAKFYYYPGWHEPSSNLELTLNRAAWDKLPNDLQTIVRVSAAEAAAWSLAKSEAANGPALERLKTQFKVNVQPFPDEVLKGLHNITKQVIQELVEQDPIAAKVHTAYEKFRGEISSWANIGEEAYAKALRL